MKYPRFYIMYRHRAFGGFFHGRPGGGNLISKTMNTTHDNIKGKAYNPKPGNYVLVTVTDTGIGIGKKTQERIFDPFFTTKEMGRGTGLGLASAYGIIRGHGGYIDLKSKKGKGTTFSIYLPASEKKVRKAVKTTEQLIQGTGTVLLVDKVLLSSGYSINGQATEILERGCDGFIQKPFSMKELSIKIRDILCKK